MTSRERKYHLSLSLVLLTAMALVPTSTGGTTVGAMTSGITATTSAASIPPGVQSQNPKNLRDGLGVAFESTADVLVPTPVTMSDNIVLANLQMEALMLVSGNLPVSMTMGSTSPTTGAMTGATTGAATGVSTGTLTGTTGAETPTLSGGTTAAAGSTVGAATSTFPGFSR